MAQKLPPPPPIANQDQAFNRWLLEITSILSSAGGIDPNSIVGLPEVIAESAANTLAIGVLDATVSNQGDRINTLESNIDTLQSEIVAINGQLTALGARAQVLNGAVDPAPGLGNVNDWYANTAGAAGHRIFVKTGAATWTAFAF